MKQIQNGKQNKIKQTNKKRKEKAPGTSQKTPGELL